MGAHIDVVFHLQGHESVDILLQEDQTIIRPSHIPAGELVSRAPALETKVLENRERCVHRQAVDVHHTGLLDGIVGIVGLVDGHSHPVGFRSELGDRVDDQSVVLLAVVGGDHVQAIADLEQGCHVVLVDCLFLTSHVVLAELLGKSLDLSLALVVQSVRVVFDKAITMKEELDLTI